jgi:hypothetical protein
MQSGGLAADGYITNSWAFLGTSLFLGNDKFPLRRLPELF